MKKFLFVWAVLLGALLLGCSWKPAHLHIFGPWTLKEQATCAKEGIEERICAKCQAMETRPIAALPHILGADSICTVCNFVSFDPDTTFVELGIFSDHHYIDNTTANEVWDVKIWGDLVHRGAGDYNKNSGATPFYAYNIRTQSWVIIGNAQDEAIQRFVEIGGKLYTPGIDATGSWDKGNFYVLEGDVWKQMQTLPNTLHNFDLIEFDGILFAGVGTETLGNTVALSKDGGESFTFVPLYRDGKVFSTAGYDYSRTYEFMEYGGELYAMLSFKKLGSSTYDKFIFRYEAEKMVYVTDLSKLLQGSPNRNCWQGKLEWNGVCYITTTGLNAITDFADPDSYQRLPMPNQGVVSDILLYQDALYVLSFVINEDSICSAVIYRSTTGAEGSFTEVATFDYPGMPIAFDFDGTHFYVGIGIGLADPAKAGMLLRVKA